MRGAAIRAERWVPRRLHWWIARRVFADLAAGTCVLLFDESLRVFLVTSTYGRGWSTPGGFIAQGENAAVAAARELREELAIAPPLVEVAGRVRVDRPVVDVVFVGRVPSTTEIHTDGLEIRSGKWLDLAAGIPTDADPEVPVALATLRRSLGSDALHPVFDGAETDRLRALLRDEP